MHVKTHCLKIRLDSAAHALPTDEEIKLDPQNE